MSLVIIARLFNIMQETWHSASKLPEVLLAVRLTEAESTHSGYACPPVNHKTQNSLRQE